MSEGILYVVATPIGNLEDITFRALRILKEVDLIACEDTRHTGKLLAHYAVHKPLESYHEHNELTKSEKLVNDLLSGKRVALVSDAGTPGISDPGYRLIKLCIEKGLRVVPLPGPVAFAAALSASGLPTDRFSFFGFAPARRSQRIKFFEQIQSVPHTLIFHESPQRVVESLDDLHHVVGDRHACLARELTKVYEEFIRGTLTDIIAALKERPGVKGEITLIVEGASREIPILDSIPESIEAHLCEVMARTGLSKKEALKLVAKARGLTRREAYNQLLKQE
jgi:16S rRNA (cytidine1402-2'-O)-methyltransferase